MPVLDYVFRECQNAGCRFRYPAPAGSPNQARQRPAALTCPKCGSPTRQAVKARLSPESQQLKGSPSVTNNAVLLDNLRSAWNVGSILRTADGAGLLRVYLCGITPTPEHPRVERTALGAQKNLQWSWHANSLLLARELLQKGFRIWALESLPQAEPLQALSREDSGLPVVLVIGNEIAGVDPDLLALAERVFAIPMRGIKQSLNAAVAFGIAAYELEKTRSD